MANLNLSEFTEKLFVADADHTFIWDTQNAISKRVSRNSWLNSGTLTSDAPVTISQTWGTTGTYTAAKVNVTETATANTLSRLLDLQLGAVSKLAVRKDGSLLLLGTAPSGVSTAASAAIRFTGSGRIEFASEYSTCGIQMGGSGTLITAPVIVLGGASIGISNDAYGNNPSYLVSEAANTLALRNGAAAQTFNVYGTSSASNANYARLALTCGLDGNATISTQALGTGTAGTVSINGVPVGLGKGNLSSNIAIGTSAMAARTDGGEATALGSLSLLYATNVSRTTAIGYGAGATLGNGAQNTSSLDSVFIGYDTRSFAINQSNQIVIGNSTTGIGSNSVVLGNDSITKTALKGNVGIGTTSPTSKLHVVGDGLITGTLGIGDTGTSLKQFVIAGQPISNSLYLSSPMYIGLNAPIIALMNGGVRSAMWDRLTGITLTASSYYGFNSHETDGAFAADTILRRDGEPYHLATRNGTNGQKFSVYGTYPGAAWERFTITAPTSGNVLLGTYKGTGGIARGLELQADGTTRMLITAAGAIIQRPLASVTPPDNGDLVIEATSNTTLTFKLKGTDGTVRTGTITLA